MAAYFTSDLHFHHKSILEKASATRGMFKSPDEMIKGISDQWNSVVGDTDDVYHLGDFCFSSKIGVVMDLLGSLRGRKHLVLGNHDNILRDRANTILSADLGVIWIRDYAELRIDGQKIILFHYPISVWKSSHQGSWQLHGHSHGNHKPLGKQADVGWDSIDFAKCERRGPLGRGIWSFSDVKEVMEHRKFQKRDHHEAR